MKFFIKGTLLKKEKEELKNRFREYCRQLGMALAKGGHTIILGCYDGTQPDLNLDYMTVGPSILKGANEVPGKHVAKLFNVEDDDDFVKFTDDCKNWSNIEASNHPVSGDWRVDMSPAIEEADGVILIGGYTNTAVIGATARELNKPVLAIPAFDGSAKELWKSMSAGYTPRIGLSSNEIELLQSQNIDNRADEIIEIAEKLVKSYKSHGTALQTIMLTGVLALVGSWIALFVNSFGLIKDISFFLLLGISALLGTFLRNSMNLLSGEKSRVTSHELLVDITVSILLAFGFSLLYLGGVVVLTGKVISITGQEDFTRISVSMSLLGFGAALLFDKAYKIITARFENVLPK